MQKGIILILLFILFFVGSSCIYGKKLQLYEVNGLTMDTLITIKAYGEEAPLALEQALNFYAKVDSLLNRYDAASDIYKINSMAGIKPVPVDELTYSLIKEAVAIGEATGGAVDITVGPMVDLWSIADQDEQYIPSAEELKAALKLVDYSQIILDQTEKTVFLPNKGQSLDLGAVAKGFATRGALEILQRYGITSGLVIAGGNIHALGNKPGGKPWQVSIQDPFNLAEIMATMSLKNAAVDTAAGYFRYKEIEGRKFSHIINPFTGLPAGEIAGATVLAEDPLEADALSTAVFVLGQQGLELLQNRTDASGILVTKQGQVKTTSNLTAKAPDFKLVGDELDVRDK